MFNQISNNWYAVTPYGLFFNNNNMTVLPPGLKLGGSQ